MTFAQLMKDTREKHGYTLQYIHDITGVTIANLSDYERGRRIPSTRRVLLGLSEVLQLDFSYIENLCMLDRGIIPPILLKDKDLVLGMYDKLQKIYEEA